MEAETFGLTTSTLSEIIKNIAATKRISKAVLFGSRVKGNFKPTSDIDISLYGTNLDIFTIRKLSNQLEESNIIQRVDLINYSEIDNISLLEHIDRCGVTIYTSA
ncbi:MAG: nucleotidyltransferase domain-containing protein [Spirochaetales bacterium]|nr:nucleotidyltransferase domain-containing protein [Spirochaetales bacterium]